MELLVAMYVILGIFRIEQQQELMIHPHMPHASPVMKTVKYVIEMLKQQVLIMLVRKRKLDFI